MKEIVFNPDPNLYPDESGRAARMSAFVRRLRLWEGDFAGERFHLYPFQEAMLRRIYGPVAEDGSRLVRIVNIWLPRGNAKTTLAAALALGHFLGPEAEAGGQIIAAAADRENAGIAFNCGFQMIQQDDALLSRIRPIESRKIMLHPKTSSTFKAISTESYSKHGLNVSFFLADEIHAWPPSEARKLWKVVTDSMVKRSNPLTVVISTAGEGMGGLACDMWDYSHRVASGEIDDDTFAPIIFAAPPERESEWKSEELWRMANPAIDAGFLSLTELKNKVKRAEHFPTDAADFKRFHLNLWIEGAAAPWIDLDTYDKCEDRPEIEAFKGETCWVGVDLSSVEDLTAVVAVFPDRVEGEEERAFDIVPMFFLPEAGLKKKSDRDQANYLKWVDEGYLKLTPGNRIDQKFIHDYVVSLTEDYNVVEVAVDRWNSTAFITGLLDVGIEAIEFGQGYGSMAGPVKEIKSTVLAGKFRHGKNPILRMCFANVVTEKDSAENEKFTKSKARGRIDGMTASAMAIGRILVYEAEQLNVYRGVFSSDESYSKAFGRRGKAQEREAELVDDGSWSQEVLANPSHKDFEEHKLRFERWSERQDRGRDW